ncbi:MAG: dihydropteroate synthase [Betaproteobacteria bacterium]|nr:dihydropteroate synthase [Betaproteobacteria bacterium]
MGIVNVTPDSFSDGGRFYSSDQALDHARRLIDAGADALDIGGESTRPGAQAVSEQEELERILPVLEGLRDCGVTLSVDTMKPAVMRAALAAGATMINDVRALQAPGALEAVRNSDCAVCLMHMQGEPRSMQDAPQYGDVLQEVYGFLAARIAACGAAGVARDRLYIDPGFGFGKTLEHNLALLRGLPRLAELAPVLVGVSRKRMLGEITGRPVDERLAGSIAAALRAVEKGAAIVRVHDVAATVDALKIWERTR